MAKGIFGGLKGFDAFGKVSSIIPADVLRPRGTVGSKIGLTDDGGCESEDEDWCFPCVAGIQISRKAQSHKASQ